MIERDYLELKQELGLGHYEGRGWPGFHHHGALCIAAYGFLIAEKAALPPSAPETTWLVQVPELPKGHRPRGSPDPNRAPSAQLDRNTARGFLRRAELVAKHRQLSDVQQIDDIVRCADGTAHVVSTSGLSPSFCRSTSISCL